MNNPDHISESLETVFGVKILKFFEADPGSGMEKIRIRDLGSDPQHCSRHVKYYRYLILGLVGYRTGTPVLDTNISFLLLHKNQFDLLMFFL